ncbi:metal-dependent hydrolase [Sinobaca sp. H24]|uniref:metal-dependent hydrolase n=1 Tax=Sinobaca sp. H24 TaxID=2923376 RepID=UPI0020793E3B|nr:metal-dependent hydrolase [Sinobaca sp. H24]
MDTLTHALFGMATYGAIDKSGLDKPVKRSIFFASLVGSQAPDADVFTGLTETGQIMGLLWHRGLTHSFFMAPVWALLIFSAAFIIWKQKHWLIFFAAFINVVIHNTLDGLNAWGTGWFEPLSSTRVALGFLPIVDVVIWTLFAGAFFIKWKYKDISAPRVWRTVLVLAALHTSIQGLQGTFIINQVEDRYDQVELSAGFVPGSFNVIGKKNEVVTIKNHNAFGRESLTETLYSQEEVNLDPLLEKNKRAEVLIEWAPFVVVTKDETELGVYDPRFYFDGEKLLFESIPSE